MLSQNTINIHLNLQTEEAEAEEEEKIKFHHLLCVKLYISSVLFVKYNAVIKSWRNLLAELQLFINLMF